MLLVPRVNFSSKNLALAPEPGLVNVEVVPRAGLRLALLAALFLVITRPAQGQTEQTLYNFTGGSDGGYPSNLTLHSGSFYGTTGIGNTGNGGVFELSPNSSGGWNESVLYSFTGGADGALPAERQALLEASGNLYGTARDGGAYGYGVVFELSPSQAGWTETTLYSFTGAADGGNPSSGVIMDSTGNLYGIVSSANGMEMDSVFELSPSNGGWTEQVLYSVGLVNPDFNIEAGLTMDAAGNIFGATYSTVFELSPNGSGGFNPAVLHTFTGGTQDGIYAAGTPVLDSAGNIYGTTTSGGNSANSAGTVYKLSPVKNGGWTEKILYSFKGGKDGSVPLGPIAFDAFGNIYGTTNTGGKVESSGTVFELLPNGKGGWAEKVLFAFDRADGAFPMGSVVLDSAGDIYGTTPAGGLDTVGVVFEINPSPRTTVTTLASSPNPSTSKQIVTFTAVVEPAPPDGEIVSFMRGSATLGTETLIGGSASFGTSVLKVGTTPVNAVYGGDFDFLGSKSNVVAQVVNK
jgi:uncharacterized repeat protein (TIGR03803 family)